MVYVCIICYPNAALRVLNILTTRNVRPFCNCSKKLRGEEKSNVKCTTPSSDGKMKGFWHFTEMEKTNISKQFKYSKSVPKGVILGMQSFFKYSTTIYFGNRKWSAFEFRGGGDRCLCHSYQKVKTKTVCQILDKMVANK